MKRMTTIEKNLQLLYEEVNRMIEEGDKATASDMIEAKYKAINGKWESGIQGMEQATMLDIKAQLRTSLGSFEEVALLRFVATSVYLCQCYVAIYWLAFLVSFLLCEVGFVQARI